MHDADIPQTFHKIKHRGIKFAPLKTSVTVSFVLSVLSQEQQDNVNRSTPSGISAREITKVERGVILVVSS